MNWFKNTIWIISHINVLNFIWLALTVPHVLLWCYQQNYCNLWRVQISSTNTSGPMSLLQSINAHLMMNTENQSLFKANYCVFKWQTITHFPNWRGVLIKLLFLSWILWRTMNISFSYCGYKIPDNTHCPMHTSFRSKTPGPT